MALDPSVIDGQSAEAEVPRREIAQVLEGIEDYLSLDLREESKDQLQALRQRYSKRLNLSDAVKRALAEAKAAIEALIADGHPQEPAGIVDREVIEDMDANLDTLLAARRRFTPRPITTIGKLTVGQETASS